MLAGREKTIYRLVPLGPTMKKPRFSMVGNCRFVGWQNCSTVCEFLVRREQVS